MLTPGHLAVKKTDARTSTTRMPGGPGLPRAHSHSPHALTLHTHTSLATQKLTQFTEQESDRA
jgi:hypothetical protein